MSNQDTKAMLSRYNKALQDALNNGLKYTKLLNRLIESDDNQDLLDSAKQLVTHHLDNAYLKYPQQYSPQDYYLLFMNRLFEQHDQGRLVSVAHGVGEAGLSQQLYATKSSVTFQFKINTNQNGGAFYHAVGHSQPLFYINLTQHLLKFNSREVTKLFLIDLFGKADLNSIKQAIETLRQFGQMLVHDYHFEVDFSILEQNNDYFYEFVNAQLPKNILDQLFIIAARKNYMLKAYHIIGAELDLKDTAIYVYPDEDKHWGLQVVDKADQLSWLELMVQHDFLRQWYLNNIKLLEMSTDDLIFS